jgi:hypothetical protein
VTRSCWSRPTSSGAAAKVAPRDDGPSVEGIAGATFVR